MMYNYFVHRVKWVGSRMGTHKSKSEIAVQQKPVQDVK